VAGVMAGARKAIRMIEADKSAVYSA
jgi:hypothetical protein